MTARGTAQWPMQSSQVSFFERLVMVKKKKTKQTKTIKSCLDLKNTFILTIIIWNEQTLDILVEIFIKCALSTRLRLIF